MSELNADLRACLLSAAAGARNKRLRDLTDFEQVAIAYMAGVDVEIRVVGGIARVATKDMVSIGRRDNGKFVVSVSRHDA